MKGNPITKNKNKKKGGVFIIIPKVLVVKERCNEKSKLEKPTKGETFEIRKEKKE